MCKNQTYNQQQMTQHFTDKSHGNINLLASYDCSHEYSQFLTSNKLLLFRENKAINIRTCNSLMIRLRLLPWSTTWACDMSSSGTYCAGNIGRDEPIITPAPRPRTPPDPEVVRTIRRPPVDMRAVSLVLLWLLLLLQLLLSVTNTDSWIVMIQAISKQTEKENSINI